MKFRPFWVTNWVRNVCVTRCKECTEWHSFSILFLSEHLEALGVAQHLVLLQRPVMVIFIQSALSMSLCVSGLIRIKSNDIVSG